MHKVTEQGLLSTLLTIRHTNLSNVLRANQPNVRHCNRTARTEYVGLADVPSNLPLTC
jgi:hypothetical protein